MFRKGTLTALAMAAALFAAPVLADDANFAGTLSVHDAYVLPTDLPDASLRGLSGEGEFGLGAGIHVEVVAGYSHMSVSDSDIRANDWNTGGSVYWKCTDFRGGAIVNHTKFDLAGLGAHTTNYGAFGEYYANDRFTFGVNAGGFGGDVRGVYVGGGATGYVFPDFAVSGTIGYTRFNGIGEETDLGLRGEYLLSEETPIAAFAGYTHSDLPGGVGHINMIVMGLRLYTNSDGFATLVDRQRFGTVGALADFLPAGLNF